MFLKKSVIVSLMLLLCLTIVVSGCSKEEAVPSGQPEQEEQERITLRLAHEMPETHPYHLGSAKFAELLAEKTNGRIEVVIYTNAQLGKQKQVAEMVAANQIDMGLVWQGILEGFDPDVGVISLPFLYRDWDHVWNTLDGPIGQELMKGVEDKGIKVLTNFYNGLFNIVSVKPIKNPADMKGLKLRVQSSAVFTKTGELLGAVVTPMSYAEVYTALQLGTMDAEISSAIAVFEGKHDEVAKYTCENNINYLVEPVLMSKKLFDSFSAEDQAIIMEAAVEAAEWQRDYCVDADVVARKAIEDNGMQYYTADIDEWKNAVMPVYDEYPQWADMVEKIRAVE